MPDTHYEHPRLAAIYDLSSGWSEDRDFYLELAGDTPSRILDLGCGTGLICRAYAKRGHHVTGADPAPAMLEVARNAEFGDRITWVNTTAQQLRLEQTFDLIIMTGHAFQVFLTDEDLDAALASVAAHLAPHGRFVFETRNPEVDWATRWDTTTTWETNEGTVTEERRILERTRHRILFDTHYHFSDATITSRSDLRFFEHDELVQHLHHAGLEVTNFFGDWQRGLFVPSESEEMIYEVTFA